MKIYAYKGDLPNLGDDLNHWLWPKVLPQGFLSMKGIFIGIGSVLDEEHFRNIYEFENIHILGAACRSENFNYHKLTNTPNFHALRGPLSHQSLKLRKDVPLVDGAYAFGLTDLYRKCLGQPKQYKYCIITYFRSKSLIHYQLLEKLYPVKFLHTSDYGSIEKAIETIAKSEKVISESLHGAIIADMLRIPWKRLRFFLKNPRDRATAKFKWKDWAMSIQLANIPTLDIPFRFKSWYSPRKNKLLRSIRTIDYLTHLNFKGPYTLSNKEILSQKIHLIEKCIHKLDP